jgi:hypothetical protein
VIAIALDTAPGSGEDTFIGGPDGASTGDEMTTDTARNYRQLRAAASEALRARNAIDGCFTPEWREAHRVAKAACTAADNEMTRLAKVDRRNVEGWQGAMERELILLGYV